MSLFKKESPFTILAGDSRIKDPDEVLEWCKNTSGFIGVTATDVSDVSMNEDIIYAYMFDTEEVANWFKLRWL